MVSPADINKATWPNGPANLSRLIETQPGSVVSRVLLKRKTGNVTLFAFAPGQDLSEHTAPFDALLQVLQGQATISIAGTPFTVLAGEAILLPAGKPHAVQAVSALHMLLTMIRE